MTMTLKQLRDWHREVEALLAKTGSMSAGASRHKAAADAIDAHLTQSAQSVDVVAANSPPRRAVRMIAKIDAHTRRDLADHLRQLAFDIEREEWESSISGGVSSGHIVHLSIDNDQTAEKWRAQLDAWIAKENGITEATSVAAIDAAALQEKG